MNAQHERDLLVFDEGNDEQFFERDWLERTRAKPYKSYRTPGCCMGAGIFGILALPFGPIGVVLAGLVGSGLGSLIGLCVDCQRRKKKVDSVQVQNRKMGYFMRWAHLNLETAESPAAFVKLVVLAFYPAALAVNSLNDSDSPSVVSAPGQPEGHSVIAGSGPFSLSPGTSPPKVLRRQMRRLVTFLKRDEVQQVSVGLVLEFKQSWKEMSMKEIREFHKICFVCDLAFRSLRKKMPTAYMLMGQILALPAAKTIFGLVAEDPEFREEDRKALKEMECYMYAAALEEEQDYADGKSKINSPEAASAQARQLRAKRRRMSEGPLATFLPPGVLKPSDADQQGASPSPMNLQPHPETTSITPLASGHGARKASLPLPLVYGHSGGAAATPRGGGQAPSGQMMALQAIQRANGAGSSGPPVPSTSVKPPALQEWAVPSRGDMAAASGSAEFLVPVVPEEISPKLTPGGLPDAEDVLGDPVLDHAIAIVLTDSARVGGLAGDGPMVDRGGDRGPLRASSSLLRRGASGRQSRGERERTSGSSSVHAAVAAAVDGEPGARRGTSGRSREGLQVSEPVGERSTVPRPSLPSPAAAAAAVPGGPPRPSASSGAAGGFDEDDDEEEDDEVVGDVSQWMTAGRVGGKGAAPVPRRLFRSLNDLLAFDPEIKMKQPIQEYELEFVHAMEREPADAPGWDKAVDRKDVQVFKQFSPESPVIRVKSLAFLEGIPPAVVAWNIKDIPSRTTWDKTFNDFLMIETDREGCEIIYCFLRAPFPLSNRDFLQWRRTHYDEENDVWTIMHRSAWHPHCPDRAGTVRADTMISCYIIKRLNGDPNSARLFILNQTDVKGLVPKLLANAGAASTPPRWVANLKRGCTDFMKANPGKKPDARVFGVKSPPQPWQTGM